MKLSNAFAILSLVSVGLTPIAASPVADSDATPSVTSGSVDSGVAPILAQFFQGLISSVEQLSPTAAQNASAAVQQACESVKELDTAGAQLPPASGSGILSPVAYALNSFVGAVLPSIAPFLTAVIAITTGDPSASPAVVAIVQQTCNAVFSGEAAAAK